MVDGHRFFVSDFEIALSLFGLGLFGEKIFDDDHRIEEFQDLGGRLFIFFAEKFHRLIRDNEILGPQFVLETANVIGNVEEDKNVLIEERGEFGIHHAIFILKIRRIGDDVNVIEFLRIPIQTIEEGIPNFGFVGEILNLSEELDSDVIAGDNEGVGMDFLILSGPSRFAAAG
jgi:hypothetical protein